MLEKLPSEEFRLFQDEYGNSSLASELNCTGELAFILIVTISPEQKFPRRSSNKFLNLIY